MKGKIGSPFRKLTHLEVLDLSFSLTEQTSYRYFMISGLKGAGVKDLSKYLMEQACFLLGFTAIKSKEYTY